MDPKDVTSVKLLDQFGRELLRQANMEHELTHGERHQLQRVPMETRVLCRLCPNIHWAAKLGLKISGKTHDYGRAFHGPNHAHASADLFEQMPISDLNPEIREAVIFAIRHHNIGLTGIGVTGRPNTLKEIVLGLLVVCDHADGIGAEGFARAAVYSGMHDPPVPLLSNEGIGKGYTADEIRAFLRDTSPLNPANAGHAAHESVIAHLAWQIRATFDILKPVEHLLSNAYRAYYNVKLQQSQHIMKLLLRQQEAKDEMDDRWKMHISQLGN